MTNAHVVRGLAWALALTSTSAIASPRAFAQDGASAGGAGGAADERFYLRAATCAAALEVDQLALVARARAGDAGLRPALVDLTRLGFTYVGVAWKRGLRNPRADGLLASARAEQRGWPADRHAATVAACRAEAQALFDGVTGMERWLLSNRAAARVDRYLAVPAASAASR